MNHGLETGEERYARITRRLVREHTEELRTMPRTIARYLTLSGQALGREDIEVTVTETGPRGDRRSYTVSRCSGCKKEEVCCWTTDVWTGVEDNYHTVTIDEAADQAEDLSRLWSSNHAGLCREIPVGP